jgi:hypothetical protein
MDKLVLRHTLQTLAAHKAIALLRMYLIDSTKAPYAVEEALRELEIVTEPTRTNIRVKRVDGQTKKEHTSERQRKRRLANPEKYDNIKREGKIKRRMDRGMSREMAEIHADSGARFGPGGEDLDPVSADSPKKESA